MLGRCRITTSSACVDSIGILCDRPSSASSNALKLTCPIHLSATLKILSLPSPGSVNSSSTWENVHKTNNHLTTNKQHKLLVFFVRFSNKGIYSRQTWQMSHYDIEGLDRLKRDEMPSTLESFLQ